MQAFHDALRPMIKEMLRVHHPDVVIFDSWFPLGKEFQSICRQRGAKYKKVSINLLALLGKFD